MNLEAHIIFELNFSKTMENKDVRNSASAHARSPRCVELQRSDQFNHLTEWEFMPWP
jgi:uncharacterized protein (DUF1499 family)